MRKRILNIVLIFFILAGLSSTQIVANFLHTHQHSNKYSGKEPRIIKDETSCKICQIDLTHDIFVQNDSAYNPEFIVYNIYNYTLPEFRLEAQANLPSRAPPAFLL